MAGTAWTDEETTKLIEIWGEEEIQVQLEGCKRNIHIYQKIAKELGDVGYERTAVQCREKIKKLRSEYKKIKDNNDETGRKRKGWRYYDAINDVLGCKPATQPPVLVDTLAEDTLHVDGLNVELSEIPPSIGSSSTEIDIFDDVHVENTTGNETQDDIISEEPQDNDADATVVKPKVTNESKPKRKRTREDKFQKTIGVLEKLAVGLKDSDDTLLKKRE